MSPNPHSEDWSDYAEPEDKPSSVELVRWYAHPPMRFSGGIIGVALTTAFMLGWLVGGKTAHAGYWVKSKMPSRREHTRH
jgi:hypothetical protein